MPSQPLAQHVIRFGLFEADLSAGELRRQGRKVKLQDQPFQVLAMLLRRPGEVVTREELQRELWPADTFVEFDQGLNTAIKKIRQALGDSADNPRFVETIPRKGYRFIAPVMGTEPAAERQTPPVRRRAFQIWALTTLFATGIAVAIFVTHKTPELAPEPIPLTTYPGGEGSPSFSPDGNQVAFDWEKPGKEKPHVYVKLIGASEPQRLTKSSAEEFRPAWSPDGRTIAFLRELSATRNGVFLIPAIGGPERKLAEGYIWGLQWHPSGEWLVLAGRNSEKEPFALYFLSLATGEKRQLTWPPRSMGDVDGSVSPDGRTLVFSRNFPGSRADLYLLELSRDLKPKGEPKRITFGNLFAGSPAWSPDGKFILFIRGSFHNPGLWRMPIRGGQPGEPERLAFAGTGVRSPAISRQGHLVYGLSVVDADIWRLDLPGGHTGAAAIKPPARVISSTRLDHTPRYSPDGKRIAFGSDRSGSHEIWVCDLDGSNAVPLTSIGGPYTADPFWSPDGEWIAFASHLDGPDGAYVVRSGGGTPRHLTNSSAGEAPSGWSQDGKWIYFTSDRSGENQVWKIQWGSTGPYGEAVRITRKGGHRALESADGKYLYYLKGGDSAASIWRVPVNGGEEIQVPVEGTINSNNFDIGEHGVYFIPNPQTIRYLNIVTGKVTTIATLSGNAAYGFSVAPDERSLLFCQYEDHGSDLMLVENFR